MKDQEVGVLLLSAARHQASFAAVFAAHPALELIAVADEPDLVPWVRENNRQLAAARNLPYTEDLDAALADPRVDLVSICPEYTRHARLAVRALAAGKHVLLDKQPIGMTLAEGQAVVAAAREAAARGAKFTYVHHCLDTNVQRAVGAIAAGQIGAPRAVHAAMIASYGPGDEADISPTSRYGKAYHPDWWVEGELMHFGGYGIGAARYAMGCDVTSVYAVIGSHFNRLHRATGIDDLATLSLQFANGGVGTVVVGRAPNRAHPSLGDTFLYVIGTRGALTADWDDPQHVLADAAEGASRRIAHGRDSVTLVVEQFVKAILTGGEPLRGYRDAYAELQVLLAGYESARSGRVIELSPMET
jgi:predicted dehydrogenase